MIAFTISINGRKLYTAGGASYKALTQSLTLLRVPLPAPDDQSLLFQMSGHDFTVVGEDAVSNGLDFWDSPDIRVGDKIEIHIVDVDPVDPPTTKGEHGGGQPDA
jgi:hypothetical protein